MNRQIWPIITIALLLIITITPASGQKEKEMYADTLGFLDLEMHPPIADPKLHLNVIHLTSAPPFTDEWDKIRQEHERFVAAIEAQPRLQIIKAKHDLIFLPPEKIGIVLGLQRPPYLAQAAQEMFAAGIRFTTLAYSGREAYGAGYQEPSSGGLTYNGKLFLDACAATGLIVDPSHSSAATARNAIQYIDTQNLPVKVAATHTGIFEVYPNPRNLPTDVLLWIAKRGGIIGIPLYTFFLHEKDNSLMPFLAHVKHAVDTFGEDAVCIGSDTPYKHFTEEVLRAQFDKMAAMLDPRGIAKPRFPIQDLSLYSPDKMQILEEHLLKIFSERVVNKLVGENFYQYLLKNLP